MSQFGDAATATDTIQQHVSEALGILQRGFNGRIVNGYGIYNDPSLRHIELLEAKKAIEAAIAVLSATHWPSMAEYEADEGISPD